MHKAVSSVTLSCYSPPACSNYLFFTLFHLFIICICVLCFKKLSIYAWLIRAKTESIRRATSAKAADVSTCLQARDDLDITILIQYSINRPEFFFSILRLTTLHGGSLDYTTRGRGNLLIQEVISLSCLLKRLKRCFNLILSRHCTVSPSPSWTSWTARAQLVRLFINLELILILAKKTVRYVNILRV